MPRTGLLALEKPLRGVRMGRFTLLLFLACAAVEATDFTPRLVGDFARHPAPDAGSRPVAFASLGAVATFAATTDDLTWSLFATDGTAVGTHELQSICSAPRRPEVDIAARLGSSVYYSVRCPLEYGGLTATLWITDGTALGTRLVVASPTDLPLKYAKLEVVGDSLLFLVPKDGNTCELWRTDGPSELAVKVTELGFDEPVYPDHLLALDSNRAVVFLRSQLEGTWLVVTDGTAAGTARVGFLPISNLTFGPKAVTAGKAFFRFSHLGTTTLWTTDGTPSGTLELARFDWEEGPSPVDPLIPSEGGVYFATQGVGPKWPQLWHSAGTPESTRPISRFGGEDGRYRILQNSLTTLGADLYFVTADSYGAEDLWRVRPGTSTIERRFRLCEARECEANEFNGAALHLMSFRGRLLFLSTDEDNGRELWSTDGSAAGTSRFSNACPGPCSAHPVTLAVVDDLLLFVQELDEPSTRELWLSDGTTLGTVRLGNEPQAQWGLGLSPSQWLDIARAGGRWHFASSERLHGTELWSATDAPDSAQLVVDLLVDRPGLRGISVAGVVAGSSGEELLFSTDVPNGRSWTTWRTHGSASSTRPILERPIVHCHEEPRTGAPLLLAADAAWYFSLQNGCSGRYELVRFDPRSGETTTLLPAADDSSTGFSGKGLYRSRGEWAFLGSVGFGDDLLATDGTVGGTRRIHDFAEGDFVRDLGATSSSWLLYHSRGGGGVPELLAYDLERRSLSTLRSLEEVSIEKFRLHGDQAFFILTSKGSNGTFTRTLFRTDGTTSGTVALFARDGEIYLPEPGSARGPVLFTFWRDSDRHLEIWGTNGTREGTHRLVAPDRVPAHFDSGPTPFGDLVVFRLWIEGPDPSAWEHQLWITDGTEIGTRLLAWSPSRSHDSFVGSGLVASGGRLFFFGNDEAHGVELWSSDGTADGTGLFVDLLPGPDSSSPHELLAMGERVFWSAALPEIGHELWTTTAQGPPALVSDFIPGPGDVETTPIAPVPAHPTRDAGPRSTTRFYFLADDGATGRELWSTGEGDLSPCLAAASTLCLQHDRFAVTTRWSAPDGRSGSGSATPLSDASGLFWFFSPESPEVVVKLLDACALPDARNFWSYAAGLTDIEVQLAVRDTWTGESLTHLNPQGHLFDPLLETASFRACFPPVLFDHGAAPEERAPTSTDAASSGPPYERSEPLAASGLPGSCVPDPLTLCLDGNRFEVTADWQIAPGLAGSGTAVSLSDNSGSFWFFDEENVELLVKIVDACSHPLYRNHWLYAAGLTDIGVTLRVRDTVTGELLEQVHPAGRPFPTLRVTGQFRSCPASPTALHPC